MYKSKHFQGIQSIAYQKGELVSQREEATIKLEPVKLLCR